MKMEGEGEITKMKICVEILKDFGVISFMDCPLSNLITIYRAKRFQAMLNGLCQGCTVKDTPLFLPEVELIHQSALYILPKLTVVMEPTITIL